MRFSKLLFAVALVALASAVLVESTEAQRRGRGGFGMGRGGGNTQVSEISLLQMDAVIKHLKEDFGLEDEAVEKLKDIAEDTQEEIRAEQQEMREEMRDAAGDRDAMQEMMQEYQETVAKINDDAWKTAKGMLNEKQQKRLAQLKVQRMGVAALQNKKIQEELDFSKEQIAKIKKTQEKFAEEQQEMMQDLREELQGGDRSEMQEKMAEFREQQTEMRQSMEKDISAVLTDKQKKKLEEMKGESFKFPERQGRRGRGR